VSEVVGNPGGTNRVNAVYTLNPGPQDAVLLAELQGEGRPRLAALEEQLRRVLPAAWPNVHFSFEPGDIISQILSFGATTPIQVTVSGKSLGDSRRFAERVAQALQALPQLRDVQLPVALDYPTLDVRIDRERAGQLGLTVDRVGRSIVSATSSSALTTPIFWTDPTSGVGYRVQVRVPEAQLQSVDALD